MISLIVRSDNVSDIFLSVLQYLRCKGCFLFHKVSQPRLKFVKKKIKILLLH